MEQKTNSSRQWSFPNALDFVVMIFWVFLSQVAAVVVTKACGLEFPDMRMVESTDEELSLWAQLSMAESLVIVYPIAMILSIAGILLYRRLRGGTNKIARFSPAGFNPSLILGGIVWIVATQILLEPVTAMLPEVPNAVGRGFFAILVSVILAPIFEELLCRGIVLESIRAKRGVIAAWIWSSIFFAVIHGQIASMVTALVVGLILGYIYIRSRSIFSVIILHALNNGLALMAISFGFGDSTFADIIPDKRIYMAVYAVSALIFLIGGITLGRQLAAERRREKYPVQE